MNAAIDTPAASDSHDLFASEPGSQPRLRLAAYIVGHDSLALRLWQVLFRQMPDPGWQTFDAVPYAIDRIQSALVELGPYLAPAVPILVQPILTDLRDLNDRMIDAFENAGSPSASLLLSTPVVPGEQDWKKLCRALSPAVMHQGALSRWLALGQAVGRLELRLREAEPENLPSLQPLIVAAQRLVDADPQAPQQVRVLAEASGSGPSASIQVLDAALSPGKRRFRLGMVVYDLQTATRDLDRELQAELEQETSWDDATLESQDSPTAPATAPESLAFETSEGAPPSRRWFHQPEDQRPERFKYGPLEGRKSDLAQWVLVGKCDHRALETAGRQERYWIVQRSRTAYALWFPSHEQFAHANSRKLQSSGGGNPQG